MLSFAEISKDNKINKADTQKRNKGAKETEKKRKKVKQNAGCSHSETHRIQQKKARLISLPSSTGKQACRSFDKHVEHGKSTKKQAATSIKAKRNEEGFGTNYRS
jgi:hypothetical protein